MSSYVREREHERRRVMSSCVDAYQPPKGHYKASELFIYPGDDGIPPPPAGLIALYVDKWTWTVSNFYATIKESDRGGKKPIFLKRAHWVAVTLESDVPGEPVFVLGAVHAWSEPCSGQYLTIGLKMWCYTPDAFAEADVLSCVRSQGAGPRLSIDSGHFTAAEVANPTSEETLVRIWRILKAHPKDRQGCDKCDKDEGGDAVWSGHR